MIQNMYVKNFVLIDELSLDFHPSFSTFTGETGAGKSLFIDALSILCGARVNASYIQSGEKKALIEASFQIPDHHPVHHLLQEAGYELEDGLLVLSREFTVEGKSNTRINHRQTTVGFIKEVMSMLVDIHSQHDSQYLLQAKSHIHLLDKYLVKPLLLKEVKDLYKDYQQKKQELDTLLQEEFNVDDLDFFEFQLKEIDDLDIQEGEIERLEQLQKEMSNFEKTASKLQLSLSLFDQIKLEHLFSIQKELEGLDNEALISIKEEVANAYYSINEQRDNLHSYIDGMDFDEATYNEVQSRLYDIQKIIRKHGYSYDDLINKQIELQAKIHAIKNRESFVEKQRFEIEKAHKAYIEKANELSELRKQAALNLSKEVQQQLQDLYLENAIFEVRFNETENINGVDQVEFFISMNKGEELRPLTKVISGGELSRLMLGLKTIFNRLQDIQLVVFDEIDSGVSGNVAYAIGKKMHMIASYTQVFSITHLASVAAWGDYQYKVEKQIVDDKTTTHIIELNDEDRIKELAMISSNSTSEQALNAAQELFDSCKQNK